MLEEPASTCHCRNMRVTRRRGQDIPLGEFPGWAVDVMMGLYGEKQVTAAIAAESTTPHPVEPGTRSDLDAVESFLSRVQAWRAGIRRG